MIDSRLPSFYRLTVAQRLDLLEHTGWLSSEDRRVLEGYGERLDSLERQSENVVARAVRPVGLVTNMIVNSVPRLVPVATEEPSIVAACSRAALIARSGGGVIASGGDRLIGAQVLLSARGDLKSATLAGRNVFGELARRVREAHPRLTSAGGGPVSFECAQLPAMGRGLFVYLVRCRTGDAMGANLATEIAGIFGELLAKELHGRVEGAIVTNRPVGRPAEARVEIPVEALERKGVSGLEGARRIELMSHWAEADEARCVTHNKGILNGIEGVLAALGGDTRAVSATMLTTRGPLARWRLRGNRLEGTFRGSIPCGIVGGTGPHLCTTNLFLKFMRVRCASDLEAVLAAVGLLQNLAAIDAIAGGTLLEGHLRLHRRKFELHSPVSEVTSEGGAPPQGKGR